MGNNNKLLRKCQVYMMGCVGQTKQISFFLCYSWFIRYSEGKHIYPIDE